jgi:lysophospholipid acyltransferase (LPLAT)-like uncharacterized protein
VTTLSRRQHVKAAAIAALVTPLLEAFGGTYTWHESGGEHLREVARSGRQPIYAFWHGRVLSSTLCFRDRGIVVVTSQNFDGECITRVIRRFGYGAARGSTSRGGARALVRVRRDMANGSPSAFALDGPRGPARVAQPGAVWLASATGNPIIPFHIEASSYWTTRSWDRQQIPKPGSHVAVAIGEPFYVPARADEATIEAKRVELEHALAALERKAESMLKSKS